MGTESAASQWHERAAQLIPWLVNGTLEPQASGWLRGHLETCERCKADFEDQRHVYQLMHAEGPLLFAAEPSFHKLVPRLRLSPPESPRARARGIALDRAARSGLLKLRAVRAPAVIRWVAAAALVEALALGVGGYFWASASRTPTAAYFTLTSPAPSFRGGAQVHVVFKSNLSLGELQTLLRSVGAHIIDGPTDADVYTLGFPPQVDAATVRKRIVALRTKSAVLFAEPAPEDRSR